MIALFADNACLQIEDGGFYNVNGSNGSLYCGDCRLYVSCYDKTAEERAEKTAGDDKRYGSR